MAAKPEKKGKRKGKSVSKSQETKGFLTGILPVQDEIRQFTAFYITFITVGLDFLKDEAERIARRYQAERANMTVDQQVAFSNAFLDYRRTRQGISSKLGHLAIAKNAMDALHLLVEVENDRDRLARFHAMKVELMLNVFRLLIDLAKDLNKMSEDLKRAEQAIP
ncbi:MAG: hypothetical protein HKN28_04145 [Alphaproteobacteria bacterium]|nr:hypothetical protein [Alphaproteobacteria bacterium]